MWNSNFIINRISGLKSHYNFDVDFRSNKNFIRKAFSIIMSCGPVKSAKKNERSMDLKGFGGKNIIIFE